jgi:hypothetical protein
MADGSGAASIGDTTIADLSLLGLPLCDALHLNPLCDPAPNTELLNAPLGTLIRLNEQRCDNGGSLANGAPAAPSRRDGHHRERDPRLRAGVPESARAPCRPHRLERAL